MSDIPKRRNFARLEAEINRLEVSRQDLLIEIERLTAALREIAELGNLSPATHIARAALERKP